MEGDTTVQGENFKADGEVPMAWHGRNPRLYEELDHSYCATPWADCTCTDGVLAMHCIRKKKTYFGLTHSPLHMQMVRERLESEVFNAFQTEDDEDLAQADLIQFLTKLRGKPKGKVTPKPTNKEDKEGKGTKGNKEDKGNKADKEGTRPKTDPTPAKKDPAKGAQAVQEAAAAEDGCDEWSGLHSGEGAEGCPPQQAPGVGRRRRGGRRRLGGLRGRRVGRGGVERRPLTRPLTHVGSSDSSC